MTEYNHVLIVNPQTADALSTDIIANAAEHGAAVVVKDEDGLQALSENLDNAHIDRLNGVLPANITPSKANQILHKLNFRLNLTSNTKAVKSTSKTRSY